MFKAIASKIEAGFNKCRGVSKAAIVSVGTGLAAISVNAHAALDAAVTTAFGTLTTAFTDLLAAAYPIMATITVGLVIFGMVKMFIHKAAGR